MTNRPDDAPQTDEFILTPNKPTKEPAPAPSTKGEEAGDLTADDLMFAPGKHIPRDSIDVPEATAAPDVLFTPKKSRGRRKRKLPLLAKIGIGILIALLVLLLVGAAAFFIMYNQGRGELLETTDLLLTLPDVLIDTESVVQSEDGRTVTYKGETYRFNENRTNILCLGMDKRDLGLDYGTVGTAGQADTVVVLSIDTATGQVDALTISRDTVVDIDLHAEDGSFVGVESTQICLAYAYGDGYHGSCENMVKAVSRLLYGVPINTYFTVDLSAIPTLNDAVGGVEVVLLDNFQSSDGRFHDKGDSYVLSGRDAERYVRMRDTEELASNNDRMERQKQYITNFFAKAMQATGENLQVPLDLFNAVAADSVTNLSPSKITFLATSLVQHRRGIAFHNAPGQVVLGDDGYAEFHPDGEALYEMILRIFFTKVEEE